MKDSHMFNGGSIRDILNQSHSDAIKYNMIVKILALVQEFTTKLHEILKEEDLIKNNQST